MAKKYYLVLDLGTTGVKAFVFDRDLNLINKEYKKLSKAVSRGGRVEQDPSELVNSSVAVLSKVVSNSHINPKEIISFGITTQRETVIVWDKRSGKPVHPAIVWQDNRTKEDCKKLQLKYRKIVQAKTGLSLNPYFSASKLAWLFKNVPEVSRLHKTNNLLFGTPDTWLVWNLSKGHEHLTDFTNASRTLLFNINSFKWDSGLCQLFEIPMEILPKVLPSAGSYGYLHKDIIGCEVPIKAVVGDQQSSLYAAGVKPGTTKVTFGTGLFAMQIIGRKRKNNNDLFTTLTASAKSTLYAYESKADIGAAEVDAVLNDGKKLDKLVKKIATKAVQAIENFPLNVKKVFIDGGITQAKALAKYLEDGGGFKVEPQKIYDGTALGAAKLLKES